MAAVKRRLDVFGMLALSFAAGNAGGMTRDLLIGAAPPAAIADWKYPGISVLAGLISFFWYPIADRYRNGVLRFMAIRYGWHLPAARPPRRQPKESNRVDSRRDGRRSRYGGIAAIPHLLRTAAWVWAGSSRRPTPYRAVPRQGAGLARWRSGQVERTATGAARRGFPDS